jgi:hypothetical protein
MQAVVNFNPCAVLHWATRMRKPRHSFASSTIQTIICKRNAMFSLLMPFGPDALGRRLLSALCEHCSGRFRDVAIETWQSSQGVYTMIVTLVGRSDNSQICNTCKSL